MLLMAVLLLPRPSPDLPDGRYARCAFAHFAGARSDLTRVWAHLSQCWWREEETIEAVNRAWYQADAAAKLWEAAANHADGTAPAGPFRRLARPYRGQLPMPPPGAFPATPGPPYRLRTTLNGD